MNCINCNNQAFKSIVQLITKKWQGLFSLALALYLNVKKKKYTNSILLADAEQMTDKFTRSFYDLIILDWMMPGEDGLSVWLKDNLADRRTKISGAFGGNGWISKVAYGGFS